MSMYTRGVLSAHPPVDATNHSARKGMRELGISERRDGLLYIPVTYDVTKKSPLVVMLHGAGGHAKSSVDLLKDLADHTGFLLLAPESRSSTWDIIEGDYGPDVEFIDRTLNQVFSLYPIDRDRIAIAGFSDGGSYALSLGLTNGDLFSYIMAFSPAFMVPRELRGTPKIFVSHGTTDKFLPIDTCSRRLVPLMKQASLDVQYSEFEGGHTVPADIARNAICWFLGNKEREHAAESVVSMNLRGVESQRPHLS